MSLRIVLHRLAICLSLVTCSFSVYAEADGPDYWQVRDVEKDDVLNMRSGPDFKAAKTGEIPYDARCVRNMGCKGGLTFDEFTTLSETEKQQILKQRPRWCRVSYREATGWVAGRYLREGVCPQRLDACSKKNFVLYMPMPLKVYMVSPVFLIRQSCKAKSPC